jgi:hypothetical protein
MATWTFHHQLRTRSGAPYPLSRSGFFWNGAKLAKFIDKRNEEGGFHAAIFLWVGKPIKLRAEKARSQLTGLFLWNIRAVIGISLCLSKLASATEEAQSN